MIGIGRIQATHIVGGELNYSCLGNNQYEITLTIYRDCFFGNPNAYFDDPASIGVFDVNNQLIQEILIPLMGDDTLSPVLTDECLVIPPSVCVHTTTYIDTVELNPTIGGYTLAYQRCCRNQTILNIIDPLATGATYLVEISERALLECNSSPKFQAWPPLYICANQPIIFDQSATDVDGDSIFYRLCAPLTGADPDTPRPQPPNNPPYSEVVWQDPPYNVFNMLNGLPGGEVLTINSATGLLTGTPTTVGQFVVGICVEEYRDGELIGTLRRDFQYNVGICSEATAAFFTPSIQCGDLSVNFLNQSEASNDYLWLFGDPAQADSTSTLENPIFTYADTGTYTVTLIVEPGEFCADTFQRTIQLLPESIFAAFTTEQLYCGDSLLLQLISQSTDTLGEIVAWDWTIDGSIEISGPDPQFAFSESGSHSILLRVTSSSGCTDTAVDIFTFDPIEVPPLPDTLPYCLGDSLLLNPDFNPDYTYSWSPAQGLSDPNAPNPLASPTEVITYQLIVQNPADGCFAERSVTVMPSGLPDLVLPPDQITCLPELELIAQSADATLLYWSDNIDFDPILTEGESLLAIPQNETVYYVLARNAAACVKIDSVQIEGRAVDVTPAGEPIVCQGDAAGLALINLDPVDELVYEWTPPAGILAQTSNGIIVRPDEPGVYYYYGTVSNQFGCSLTDTLAVGVFDSTGLALTAEYIQCTGFTIDFRALQENGIFYQWDFGDPAQVGASAQGSAVSHTYSAPGTYTVQVFLPQDLDCVDTLNLAVTVGDPPLLIDFSYTLDDCTDTEATLQLMDESSHVSTAILNRSWQINDQFFSGPSPSVPVQAGEAVSVSLIIQTENGCIDTLNETITPAFIDIDLAEVVVNCQQLGVELNPDGPTQYTYAWSPTLHLNDADIRNPIANPPVDVTYTVTITDPVGGCELVRDVSVIVAEPISYELSPNLVSCTDEAILTATGTGGVQFVWSDDPTFTTILHTGEAFAIGPDLAPVYYVQINSPEGCQLLDSVLVDDQRISIDFEEVRSVCIGDSIRLEVRGPDVDMLAFNWSPVEGILFGSNSPAPVVSPEVATTYSFVATNAAGCTQAGSIQVNLFNFVPPLTIVPPVDTILRGETVTLMATDNDSYSYAWSPTGSLDTDDAPIVEASPEETTTYVLRITDLSGCFNQQEATIFVLDVACIEPFVFLPTAFSPNGDGLNDILRVEGNAIDEVHLLIYDRWGELIFESRDPDQGWDGRFRGRTLSPDVYAYVLEVRCIDGASWRKQGNVTLLR